MHFFHNNKALVVRKKIKIPCAAIIMWTRKCNTCRRTSGRPISRGHSSVSTWLQTRPRDRKYTGSLQTPLQVCLLQKHPNFKWGKWSSNSYTLDHSARSVNSCTGRTWTPHPQAAKQNCSFSSFHRHLLDKSPGVQSKKTDESFENNIVSNAAG